MAGSLRDRFAGGVFWGLAERIFSQLLFIACGVYVARMLGPDKMGLLGLITVFSGLARTICDFNFASAIIQRKQVDDDDLSTAFWTNLIIGGVLSCVFFFSSGAIASFFGRSELVPLVQFFSWTFLIGALASTHIAFLNRKMRFKEVSICESVAGFFRATLALVFVACGFDVMSLVYAIIIAGVIKVAAVWRVSQWQPSPRFSTTSFSSMFSFGIQMTGENILAYVSMNVDNLIVGKQLGAKALGLYSRSYHLMRMPIGAFVDSVKKALFPTLSKLQGDNERASAAILKVSRWIAFLCFPAMIWLSCITRPLVLLVYGEKWRALVPILQWMFLIGAPYALLTINGTICRAKGRADIALRLALWRTFLALLLFWAGCRYFGLVGVVAANGLLLLGSWIPNHIVALRLVDIRFRAQVANLRGIAAASACSGAGAFLAVLSLQRCWLTAQLFLPLLAGGLSYLVVLAAFRLRVWREVGDVLVERFGQFAAVHFLAHALRMQ